MWHQSKEPLAAFRQAVVNRRDEVHEVLDDRAFRDRFGPLHGDQLKRVPTGFDPADPDADLRKLKDLIFSRRLSEEEAFKADLPDRLADDFAAALPVFRFLAGLTA